MSYRDNTHTTAAEWVVFAVKRRRQNANNCMESDEEMRIPRASCGTFFVRYIADNSASLWLAMVHYGSQWDSVQPSEVLKTCELI